MATKKSKKKASTTKTNTKTTQRKAAKKAKAKNNQQNRQRKKKLVKNKLPAALKVNDVYLRCSENDFSLPKRIVKKKSHDIIAQDRAVKAINLGLSIRKPGYNIYVAGHPGTGKTSVIKSFLETWSKGGKSPDDWIYVYDFQDIETPKAITMKAGEGRLFKKRMDLLIKNLREDITNVLHSEEYENPANLYLSNSNDKKAKMFTKLEKKAKSMGFTIKSTRVGIETIPIVHGRAVTEKEYNKLDPEQRDEIEKRRSLLEPHILDFARKVREIEIENQKYVENLRKSLGEHVVYSHLKELLDIYIKEKEIVTFLTEVGQHIVENLLDFLDVEDSDEHGDEYVRQNQEHRDKFIKYRVNVFVDNSGQKNTPVIIESNPTYYNLFGRIEKNVEYGMYRTNFTMLKAGAIHRANGGYLVLNASDIFRAGSDSIWEFLKRVLKNQMAFIEDMGEQYSLLPTSGLRPQPIPLDIKVIIIGSAEIYHILYEEDEEFHKIFKIKADFNYKMPRNRTNLNAYAYFVKSRADSENLLNVSKSSICSVIEYGCRLVEDHQYLSTQFGDIKDLLIEADFVARSLGDKTIQRKHVEQAIQNQIHRVDLIEEQVMENVKSREYLVSVSGKRIGQVNGLSVYDYGDHVFGKAGRITCTTSMNEDGIFNIERASKLSGNIYDKGIYILSGFLSSFLAREASLGFTASVCCEQSYGMIDGDSATVAELIAVLSSLAEIPVDQSFAVTGSLNQLGDVQPVGGVIEKIEGFYKTAQLLGSTGSAGVLIPHQNISSLMLSKEVRDSISKGKFKVIPIKYFWEAFEIITGVPFGAKSIHAKHFTPGSALQIISDKLEAIHSDQKEDQIIKLKKDEEIKIAAKQRFSLR